MKASLPRSIPRLRLGAWLLAALVGVSAVAPASAGDGRFRGRGAMGHPFAARAARAERPPGPRAPQPREQAPPSQPAPMPVDRPAEPSQVDRGGRPGRLTPDERRALRQQINDAGRDLYRAPRP